MYSDLFKPSYLRKLCQQYHLSPSKKYGQNFLISPGVIQKVLQAAALKKTDTVVEIGPGLGVLTLALAQKVEKVLAFEIEKKLTEYWQEQQPKNVEIVWGNVLDKLATKKLPNYKAVANLPYQITSRLLRALLESDNQPKTITIMVQKEVAQRICAQPGKMSLLAVSVQYYGEPKIVAKVSKGNFWPSPKIDSAIVHIKLKTLVPQTGFFEVIKAGFSNRRKQLWRNLSVGLKLDSVKVKNTLKQVVGNDKIRAEELGVKQWQEIVKKL